MEIAGLLNPPVRPRLIKLAYDVSHEVKDDRA